MKGTARLKPTALLASLAWVALVAVGLGAGLLESFEWKSVDLRFTYGRWRPDPLSSRIALVAIDDGSLDVMGRWPWPRERQADAVREIFRAGAEVVAFDVMYGEPESPEADAKLAEAVASGRSILGTNVDPDDVLSEAWRTPEGRRALDALLDAVGKDIGRDARSVADELGVGEPWRSRFLERKAGFKTLAAWMRLQEARGMGKRPGDFAEFQKLMGVVEDPRRGDYPERRAMERVWLRDESWELLRPTMMPTSRAPSPRDTPPVPVLARAAIGAGMVHGPADADGHTRRVEPSMASPCGACLQLGLAAAAAYCGDSLPRVTVDDDGVNVCGWRLPLAGGKVIVDWPTAMFEGFPVLSGGGTPRPAVPIGTLVSLAAQRRVLEGQEARYATLSDEIADDNRIPRAHVRTLPVQAQALAVIRDRADFDFPGLLELTDESALQGLGADDLKRAQAYREWWKLSQALPVGRKALEEAAAEARAALGGKLVFVGFVATGAAADMINAPFGPRTPGVFVHAAVASMVLERQAVTFTPPWVAWAALIGTGLVCALAAAGLNPIGASALALLAMALVLGSGVLAFDFASIVTPLVAPLTAGFGSWVAGVATVAFVNQRERQRVVRQFRARVSPQLVDRLVSDPSSLSMRGQQREVTILFGDLAGFTSISERLGGEEVVATLNLYMGAMTKELTDRRAYVNKFLGDGLLAFWSAFGEEPEQRQLAAQAAAACQDAVTRLGGESGPHRHAEIKLRLGIATGVVVVGDCGAPPELNDYTVIGDAVNLAARLESANKQFGTRILMDGRTAAGVGEILPLLPLGRVVVVGQSRAVELFTVPPEDLQAPQRQVIERAVAAFAAGEAEAAAAWHRAADEGGAFGRSISAPFLAALEDADESRDGVLRLRAK